VQVRMLTHDIHVIKDELVRQCYIILYTIYYCIAYPLDRAHAEMKNI